MVRLTDLPEALALRYANLDCPEFDTRPWVSGPPLAERRVALVSTAGLGRRGDPPFASNAADYRVLPADTPAGEILMSHVSLGFDRTGYQRDLNVIFPVDRLKELADEGVIGSAAATNYSFMGASDPVHMEANARDVAGRLKADDVDTVALFGV
jgi:D-proline reductase (dithiol) PrdB